MSIYFKYNFFYSSYHVLVAFVVLKLQKKEREKQIEEEIFDEKRNMSATNIVRDFQLIKKQSNSELDGDHHPLI